ncbi:MAG: TetR family transcriptional regulator [Nocardioides sp.]
MPPAESASRGDRTRQTIVDAALELFDEGGYDATTMRAIATRAGVSLGSAYYYFGSKEHLIQGFYERLRADHERAAAPILASETGFARRLAGVLDTWVDAAVPYHAFAGKFFKNAAEPDSPLSPFSVESAPARNATIDLFRRVVDGSDLKVPKDLRAELPELLWLLLMGVVLFWVHDDTENQRRTRVLIDQAAPMIDQVVRLSRLPVVRGLTEDVVTLIRGVRRWPAPPP